MQNCKLMFLIESNLADFKMFVNDDLTGTCTLLSCGRRYSSFAKWFISSRFGFSSRVLIKTGGWFWFAYCSMTWELNDCVQMGRLLFVLHQVMRVISDIKPTQSVAWLVLTPASRDSHSMCAAEPALAICVEVYRLLPARYLCDNLDKLSSPQTLDDCLTETSVNLLFFYYQFWRVYKFCDIGTFDVQWLKQDCFRLWFVWMQFTCINIKNWLESNLIGFMNPPLSHLLADDSSGYNQMTFTVVFKITIRC